MIGVQVNESADDETVRRINSLATRDVIFTDHRESNRSDQATYLATQAIAYGFLGILAMITLFHTINSISISVISRTKQYGVMRAVGMSGSQLTRMIAAEAFTYAASGLIAGLGIGIPSAASSISGWSHATSNGVAPAGGHVGSHCRVCVRLCGHRGLGPGQAHAKPGHHRDHQRAVTLPYSDKRQNPASP